MGALFMGSKLVKKMILANLLLAGSCYADSVAERLGRPVDYLFTHLNLRTNWVQGSADVLQGTLKPFEESGKLLLEGSQASSAMIGKSFTSLGSSDTLNTSNPLGGGTKMEEAITEAHQGKAPVGVKMSSTEKRRKIRKEFRED